MKKYLLAIGVLICLGIAAHKVYDTFLANKPLAAVGECLEIQDPQLGRLELKIVKNGDEAGVSEAIVSVEIIPGAKMYVGAKAKYSELRDLGAEKTECSE